MFNRCSFIQKNPGKVVCERCGKWMRSDSPETCFAECKKSPCVHLGGYIREAIVPCETCEGNVRLKKNLHACSIFGECLPDARKVVSSEAFRLCRGCDRFEPLLSAPPGSKPP